MATKKVKETAVEVTAPTQSQDSYVKWEDKTNAQRLESINNYYKMLMAKAIGDKKAFWDKDMDSKEIDNTIPYNPSTGKPYGGVISLALRAVKEIQNYPDSDFLTMRQANLLHGKLKYEVNEKGEKEYPKGVKMTIMKNYEYHPKLDKDGQPLFREVQVNGEKVKQPVMDKVYLQQPKLETITLYHTSQFNDLDASKLKTRDLKPLEEYREKQKENAYDLRPKLDFLGLTPKVTQDLNNFLTSQNKGVDYKKIQHQSLNQIKKQEKVQEQGRSM
ncbi:ArdC family protein [Campylobacter helveticus]|uniref:ArdC family protein n=1 Tax=Campylobacter helveticus TaxID=28898 RepID=UPI0022EA4328|nr:ArdC family protein [Campylobacter helveticus]